MTHATLVSLEEYLASSYEPDCEYVDGEVIERNMGETDHGALQGLLTRWLLNRRKELGIYVFPETRTQISPTHFRVPDIAVTTRKIRGRVLTEPPFLCIEILSPEDRANRLEAKIDDYVNFGVAHVWVIDPGERRAWIYTREARREAVTFLTTRDPEIRLPLAELFGDLDEQIER